MISYWGIDHGDEISKADQYSPWKSYKSQGIRFKTREDAAKGQKMYVRNYYSKATAKRTAAHVGTGAAIGGTAGALLGRSAGAAGLGAATGGSVGLYSGAVGSANAARVKTYNEAKKKKMLTRDSKAAITYWTGNQKRGYA